MQTQVLAVIFCCSIFAARINGDTLPQQVRVKVHAYHRTMLAVTAENIRGGV